MEKAELVATIETTDVIQRVGRYHAMKSVGLVDIVELADIVCAALEVHATVC